MQRMSTNPDPHKYVVQLANCIQLGWDIAACQKPLDVDEWNKQTRNPLPFKDYEVGARFFLRHIPKPQAPTTSTKKKPANEQPPVDTPNPSTTKSPVNDLDTEDSTITKIKISKSLQHRWTGPYVITKKFSKILYETIINGLHRVVHIVNMKPDPFGERLREHQPLPISPLTPLPDLHQRPHISLMLRPNLTTPQQPEPTDPEIQQPDDTALMEETEFKYW